MYKVVWAWDSNPVKASEEIEQKVNQLEQEGWTSQGGISFVDRGTIYAFQTMVKKDD